MTNIHSFGAAMQNAMRPAVAGHRIYIRRGTAESGKACNPFYASSPPIGQRLVTDTGLDLSVHDRVFFFKRSDTGNFGLPMKGDVVVDLSDGSEWRIVPDALNAAWRYHGQNKLMIQINVKRDNG